MGRRVVCNLTLYSHWIAAIWLLNWGVACWRKPLQACRRKGLAPNQGSFLSNASLWWKLKYGNLLCAFKRFTLAWTLESLPKFPLALMNYKERRRWNRWICKADISRRGGGNDRNLFRLPPGRQIALDVSIRHNRRPILNLTFFCARL